MRLSKKDKYGLVVLGMTAAVVVTVVGLTIAISARSGANGGIDSETLCPYSGEYAHTIVLVDKTDPFSVTQIKRLRAKILEVRSALQPTEKLSIYVLDDKNYLAPKPVFAVCNPGSGKDANPLYQNPRKWQKRFGERFERPLNLILEQLSTHQQTNASPILEMIHSISQLHDFGADRPARRLVIFSDLIQNVAEHSHFTAIPDYRDFRKRPYATKLRPNLTGVRVVLVYLLRPELYKYQSQPRHQSFWGHWFEDSGAIEVLIERAA